MLFIQSTCIFTEEHKRSHVLLVRVWFGFATCRCLSLFSLLNSKGLILQTNYFSAKLQLIFQLGTGMSDEKTSFEQ